LCILAGVADSVSIEGTPRGYTTTMPCFPALTMAQHSTANPIVVIEEIYKATSSSRNGNPVAALLTQIEPGTARQYWDRCLAASINLSHVNWIFTSNSLEGLSAPLLSRMDIVRVTGPSTDHFDVMLDNLMNQVADEWGASLAALPHLEDEAEELLRIRFGRHRSVRRLERELRAAISAGIQVTTRLIS
jgi:ATP-dependent Lon protease